MDKDTKTPNITEETTKTQRSKTTLGRLPDSGDSVTDSAREQWGNTRDLLQKALSDWDCSEKVAQQNLADSMADQNAQKQRLENLLGLLKEKIDELSED